MAAADEAQGKNRPEEANRLREAAFHTLRHCFASWSIQAGIPIAEVQQYLGHTSDDM
jgi:integrase